MVPPSLSGFEIWCGEQSIHLRLLQIRDHSLCALLERDCPNLFAPRDMFRAVNGHEMTESVDCGQTLIPRGCAAAADLFDVGKKPANALLPEFDHEEVIDLLIGAASGDRDQQRKRIAIAPLCVPREVAFTDEVFLEKAVHPWSKLGDISHGSPPKTRSWQTGHWLPATTPASSSRNAGCWRCRCGPCRLTAKARVFARLFRPDTKPSDDGRQRRGADREYAARNARHRRGGYPSVCEVAEIPAE